jgi:hypothetical protein
MASDERAWRQHHGACRCVLRRRRRGNSCKALATTRAHVLTPGGYAAPTQSTSLPGISRRFLSSRDAEQPIYGGLSMKCFPGHWTQTSSPELLRSASGPATTTRPLSVSPCIQAGALASISWDGCGRPSAQSVRRIRKRMEFSASLQSLRGAWRGSGGPSHSWQGV